MPKFRNARTLDSINSWISKFQNSQISLFSNFPISKRIYKFRSSIHLSKPRNHTKTDRQRIRISSWKNRLKTGYHYGEHCRRLDLSGSRNTNRRNWEPLITQRHMTTLSALRHRMEYPVQLGTQAAACTPVSDVPRAYKRVQAYGWKIYAQIRGWCSLPPHGISPSQPRMALESQRTRFIKQC